MFTLDRENKKPRRDLRMAVVETLIDVMDTNPNVVALEADLGDASGFNKIKAIHPERFINVGIAEANMVGVAAGLSLIDYVPFIHSFGPFASRRVFDQLFLSGGYADTTINVYGSDPGFNAGPNGGTHTTFEDVALIKMIPNSIICDAADDVQMEWIVRELAKLKGVHYIRGNRKAVRNVYAQGSTFNLGKGNVVKEGSDVLLITAGQILSDALDAAESLQEQGISVEVIDMFTIKPFDTDLVLEKAKNKKAIVTFENHSIYGGIGSTVAEILAENTVNVPLYRMGVDERFGQVGSQEYLQKEFNLTASDVIDTIKRALSL